MTGKEGDKMPEDGKIKILSSGATTLEEPPRVKVLAFGEAQPATRIQVKVLAIGEAIPKAKNSTPTTVTAIMPGATVRKRVRVEIAELALLDRSIQGEKTLQEAQHIITNFNLDDSRDQKFGEFGVELQAQYAENVQKLFAAVNGQAVNKIKTIIDRTIALMTDFDPAKLLNQPRGLFAFFGERKSKAEIMADIEQTYAEMSQLIAQAKDRLPELTKVIAVLDYFESSLPNCLEEIESKILAGKFISSYGLKLAQEKSENERNRLESALQIFERRLESLTISRITILQGFEQMKLYRSSILNLIANIENALLTLVPLWYSGYLNALAVWENRRTSKSNATTTDLLKLQTEILRKLKGE
jgi:uncharacterized protein YaaN involved in tellurite resistance